MSRVPLALFLLLAHPQTHGFLAACDDASPRHEGAASHAAALSQAELTVTLFEHPARVDARPSTAFAPVTGAFPAAKIRDSKLSDRVAIALAREIVSGRVHPGGIVPSSEEIVDRFGVSRTVGREALQILSLANVIRVHHGRRTEVTSVNEWDVFSPVVQMAVWQEGRALSLMKDQRELLLLIEPFAAGKVAEHGDPETLDLIGGLASTTVELVTTGALVSQIASADHAFHVAIASASENRMITTVVRATESMVDHLWAAHYASYSREELLGLAQDHVLIADAIVAHDPERAAQALRNHIVSGTDLALQHFGPGEQARRIGEPDPEDARA